MYAKIQVITYIIGNKMDSVKVFEIIVLLTKKPAAKLRITLQQAS